MKANVWRITGYKGRNDYDGPADDNTKLDIIFDGRFKKEDVEDILFYYWGENGIVYVSRRNVDKSDINAGSFVPTFLTEDNTTKYFGDYKPSVDTPVQLRLYKFFPWANYMLHAHCYVDTQGIEGAMEFSTDNPIPCGAIEDVLEIVKHYTFWEDYWKSMNLESTPRLLAINLKGHGCILIAKDVEIFKELQKHKDNCFVQRPIPEVV